MSKKTSQTHPLYINELAVPETDGVIGMTLCPGKVQKGAFSGEWERDLLVDLKAINAWGASTLVTLMEPHELKACKVTDLPKRVPHGMNHVVLPILDGGVPDAKWEHDWVCAGADLRAQLKHGKRIVIHCLGGLGRTGTVAAKLLVELGMDPKQAIIAVKNARPGAIETKVQENYVLSQKPLVAGEAPGCACLNSHPHHRISPDRASRFRGCLLGGAVGDALGAPVEFLNLLGIQAQFGPEGIRDFVPYCNRLGAITDDTQMSLFTAEGAIRQRVRFSQGHQSTIEGMLGCAYQGWLVTQGYLSVVKGFKPHGWLLGHKELFSKRAPGTTCLSALQAMKDFGVPAKNQSKGCGGVMRSAPLGLFGLSMGVGSEAVFEWGCLAAGLTHGHPTGQLPAGFLAMLIFELTRGTDLRAAVQNARIHLAAQPNHQETTKAVDKAVDLTYKQDGHDRALEQLGEGWVAEEALAISIYCALTAKEFEEGVVRAVNITGDSDSTGAITGNILGAYLGVHEIPQRWIEPLELRTCITEVADDLATCKEWALPEFGFEDPAQSAEQEYWLGRYPGF